MSFKEKKRNFLILLFYFTIFFLKYLMKKKKGKKFNKNFLFSLYFHFVFIEPLPTIENTVNVTILKPHHKNQEGLVMLQKSNYFIKIIYDIKISPFFKLTCCDTLLLPFALSQPPFSCSL